MKDFDDPTFRTLQLCSARCSDQSVYPDNSAKCDSEF